LFKNNKTVFVFFLLILVVFMVGVLKLFLLRFKIGDAYPAYSSLRSDPLGTMVFYESLEKLRHVSTSRNYRSLPATKNDQDITFFYLGANAHTLEAIRKDSLEVFNRLAATGDRLIISFYPQNGRSQEAIEEQDAETGRRVGQSRNHKASTDRDEALGNERNGDITKDSLQGDVKEKEGEGEGEGEGEKHPSWSMNQLVYLPDHWGFSLANDVQPHSIQSAKRVCEPQERTLPSSLSWHTTLYFDKLDKPWKEIYSRDGLPVIIERQYGTGTIVLCADSYLFSNEALKDECHPELLSWLIGANSRVIFDEAHFGIEEKPGIAGLARKYKLHWVLAGIVLLVTLFVWRNSISFLPYQDDDNFPEKDDITSERDYTQGLINILRRNIRPQDILNICFDEWKNSSAFNKGDLHDKLNKIRVLVDAERSQHVKKRDPVSAYRAICRTLSERDTS